MEESEDHEYGSVPPTMPFALPLGAPGRLYEAQAIVTLKARWRPGYIVKPGCVLKNRTWYKAIMTDHELDASEFEAMLATKDRDHKGEAIGIDAVIVPKIALQQQNAALLRAGVWLVEIKVGAWIGPSTIGSTACVGWQLAAAGLVRKWMLVCPEEAEVQRMLREPHAHGQLFKKIEHIRASEQVRRLQRYIRECDMSKAFMYELLARAVNTYPETGAVSGDLLGEIASELSGWHARRGRAVELINDAYETIATARGADATAARLARKRAVSVLQSTATGDDNDPRWGELELQPEPLT